MSRKLPDTLAPCLEISYHDRVVALDLGSGSKFLRSSPSCLSLFSITMYYYHLFLFLHIHFFTYIPCMHSQKAVGSRRGKTTFKGICIARKNKGIASTIVLRNVLHGMVLERNVPLYSPHLLDLRVVAKRKSRRGEILHHSAQNSFSHRDLYSANNVQSVKKHESNTHT